MTIDGERLGAIHPGETIREDFLIPLGKSAYWLARGLGITETAAGEILKGKRGITPATALKLERFLGCSAEFWLGLQIAYDLDEERERLASGLETIEPADLSTLTRERQQAIARRQKAIEPMLTATREQMAGELAAMKPREEEPAAA
jgi:addiction module HigA family antidote